MRIVFCAVALVLLLRIRFGWYPECGKAFEEERTILLHRIDELAHLQNITKVTYREAGISSFDVPIAAVDTADQARHGADGVAVEQQDQGATHGPTIESLRNKKLLGFPRGAPHVAPGERCDTPKLIHQTWKNRVIPSVFTPHIDTWLTLHPKWEYRFYTDSDILRFIEDRFPEYLQMFKNYPQPIMRADAIRYFLLYEYGGVYVDLDFEALRPLDASLLGPHACLIGQEPLAHAHVLNRVDRLICNALMASCARHPFWLHVFEVGSMV
jgi:hypothetical protein